MATEMIDYGQQLGMETLAASVVFSVVYVGFAGWFTRQSIRVPTFVHYTLLLFCASTSRFGMLSLTRMIDTQQCG